MGATKGGIVVVVVLAVDDSCTTAASVVVVVVVVGMVTVLKMFLLTGLTREKGIALLLPPATAAVGTAAGAAGLLAAFVLELISTLPVMSFPAAVNLSGFCLDRLPVNGLKVVTSSAAGDAVVV